MRKSFRGNRRSVIALCALMSLTTQPMALADDMSWPSEDGSSKPKSTTPKVSEPVEAGQAAPEAQLSPESAVASPVAHPAVKKAAPAAVRAPEKTLTGKAQSTKLFGRIDQIAGEANVEMPVLKMEKAQLDTVHRIAPLRASASDSKFTGSIATSFPMDFSGTWGGTIKVWRYSVSPLSYEIDAAESNKLREILSPGTAGDVNFVFQHEFGKIDLEPAQVRIMIPASQSLSYQKMMGTGQMEGMGGMVSQMMANMKVPVILHFGTVSTRGSMEVGVSGNQIDQRVVKNDIRQLAPEVVEEQIVTRNNSVQSGSGKSENGYTESVLRFTRQSSTQLYVLAASVDYDGNGKFLRKLIMYGNVIRGQVMNTSPVPAGMGNLTQMMQGMEGGGGSGGNSMAGLSSILNGMAGAGGGQSSYGSGSSNYGSGGSSYANNPAVRQYLNNSTSGGGSNMEGFGQLMNSLNMLNR